MTPASAEPARLCLVLRRTLRDHAVRIGVEAVGVSLPVQHDLGFALERVGHDAGVRRVDDVARFAARIGLFCTLNWYSSVFGLLQDRAGHDVAVQLQRLAFPRLRIRPSTSSTCLKYSVPSRSVDHIRPANASTRTTAVDADLDISMCHKDFREDCQCQNSPTTRAMQGASAASSIDTVATGKPDHVRVRPVDARDEPRRQALNRVAAGLVAPFPARDVPGDVVVASASVNTTRGRLDTSPVSPPRDRRLTPVSTSCARPDSRRSIRARVRVVARLAEDLAVDDDRRVGAEDDDVVASARRASGLQPDDVAAAPPRTSPPPAAARSRAASRPARTRSSTSTASDVERDSRPRAAARRGAATRTRGPDRMRMTVE